MLLVLVSGLLQWPPFGFKLMECYLGRFALLLQHKCLNDSDDNNYDNDNGGNNDDDDDDNEDDDYVDVDSGGNNDDDDDNEDDDYVDNDSGGNYDYDNDDDDNDDDYIYCFVVIYLDISNYNTFSENCVLYKMKGE